MTTPSRKRDLRKEIQLIHARTKFNNRYEYSIRFGFIESALKQILQNLDPKKYPYDELLRYIPISTVACMQSFFRASIVELINSGEPFNKNVANFKGKVGAIDYDTIAAIETKAFTIGDFVAHTLSYNDFPSINASISILLNDDFTDKLKKHSRKSIFEFVTERTEHFKKKFPEIMKSVDITFKMRHTFCHEFATNVKIHPEEIKIHFENCKLFIEHSNEVISEILYPNAPESQYDMNQEAHRGFLKLDAELNDIITKIKNLKRRQVFPEDEEDCKGFDLLQEKWDEYRKLYAEFSTVKYKGGTIHPLMYSSAMSYITNQRLNSLKDSYLRYIEDEGEYSFK